MAKRRTGPVYYLYMQNTTKHSTVVYLISYLHTESKKDLCISLLFIHRRYIPIYNAKSAFTRQNTFDLFHHSRIYTHVYIGLGRTLKGHLNSTAFNKARVAQLVDHQTSNLMVVGSSPTLGKIFFILYCVAFDALLAGGLVTYQWNQACRSSEVYRCLR